MFEFDEIVKIDACPSYPQMIGKEGYIAGKCYEDGGHIQSYQVYVPEVKESYFLKDDELTSLGRFIDARNTASRTSIRVKNVNGRAVVVDDDDD